MACDSGAFLGWPGFYLDVPDARSWLFVNGFQAVGLGYGEPSPGLMERKPRPEKEPILSRELLGWLVVAGLALLDEPETQSETYEPDDGREGGWQHRHFARTLVLDWIGRERPAPKLLRADSAFWNHTLMSRLERAGWTWGGTFRSVLDLHHFSATGR